MSCFIELSPSPDCLRQTADGVANHDCVFREPIGKCVQEFPTFFVVLMLFEL